MSTTDTRAAFEAWMQTRRGYPFPGSFANLMWASWQAATEAAKATGTAGELPPEWISEVCGPDVDGLSYGQGYRRGFNDCRKKVSELQAKLITDEEAWEIIKDEARMQVIDEHGSMAIVIKSPSEAWFIARAILAANNRPSVITAEDCPVCNGQSGGIGADGVENECHECFRREVQAARQPAPAVAVKTWQERVKGKLHEGIAAGLTDKELSMIGSDEMQAEIAELRAALAATAAPVSVSERDMVIAHAVRQACVNSYSPDDSASDYTEKMGDIDLATIIRAATNRSQP